jgi:hypothetical protein
VSTVHVVRWLGAVLGWMLSVALVSGVSWMAINSAGRQVIEQSAIEQALDGSGVFDAASPTLGPTASASAPTGTPTPTGTDDQSVFAGPVEGGAASAPARAPSAQSRSTDSPPAVKVAPPAREVASDAVTGIVRTAAGSMWVECVGSSLTSVYAFPAEGWSGDPVQTVDGRAVVTFRRRPITIRVSARCDGGRPRFFVDAHDDRSDRDRGNRDQ